MIDNNEQEAGFLSYMQNVAVNSPTPFKAAPTFSKDTSAADDDDDGFTLVFSKEVTEKLKETATDLGFSSVPEFINSAVSVYGQMLGAAKNEGFKQILMINPETQDTILVPLIKE